LWWNSGKQRALDNHHLRGDCDFKEADMRKVLFALMAMLVISPVYAADVRSEIDKQNEAFDQAYASHDFKALGEFYNEDAIVYPQGADIIQGREQIQKLWESYQKDMTAVDYQTIEVIEAGDYAIQFGKYDSTYQGKPDQGRYMTVWKKAGDTWKIFRDSWYSNPTQ
jgi:ketosteroid isomerase-like protein